MEEPRYFRALRCLCGRCGGFPPATPMLLALRETALWLEDVERALGWPLLILAGWRCTEEHLRVDEPDGAEHLTGLAVDIVLRDLSPSTVQKSLVARPPELVAQIISWRGYTHIGRPPASPLRRKP